VVATGVREKGREPNKKTIPWRITCDVHCFPKDGGDAGFLPVDPDKSPLPVFLNACLIVSIVSSPLSIPKSLVFDLDGELALDFALSVLCTDPEAEFPEGLDPNRMGDGERCPSVSLIVEIPVSRSAGDS